MTEDRAYPDRRIDQLETERPTDDKGRVRADHLTEKEALTEMVILLRAFGDALESASKNPMLRAMIPGGML